MSLKRQFVTVTVSKRTGKACHGDHLREHQVSQKVKGVREVGARAFIVVFLERNGQAD